MPQPRTGHSEPFTSRPQVAVNGAKPNTGRPAPAVGDATTGRAEGRSQGAPSGGRRRSLMSTPPSAKEQARGWHPRSTRGTRLTASRPSQARSLHIVAMGSTVEQPYPHAAAWARSSRRRRSTRRGELLSTRDSDLRSETGRGDDRELFTGLDQLHVADGIKVVLGDLVVEDCSTADASTTSEETIEEEPLQRQVLNEAGNTSRLLGVRIDRDLGTRDGRRSKGVSYGIRDGGHLLAFPLVEADLGVVAGGGGCDGVANGHTRGLCDYLTCRAD